jgi:hypothetical protein
MGTYNGAEGKKLAGGGNGLFRGQVKS